jgi:hypothetical protein
MSAQGQRAVDLTAGIDACLKLPKAIKAGILTIAKSALD